MNLSFINYINLSLDDNKQLLEIRNQVYVRQNMKNNAIIELDDHLTWVDTLKDDQSKIYYSVFSDGTLVGGISITDINYQEKSSSWGLFMKSNLNPMIPSIATYLIIDKIFNTLKLETLHLEVNKENINAHKFDKNFGFIDKGEYSDGQNAYYLMFMTNIVWEMKKNRGLLKIINKKIDNSTIVFNEMEK